MARKSFSRRVIRKIKRTLRLDEAQKILETEFTDSKGNKTYIDFNVTPHNPLKTPTIQGFRKYKNNEE